MRPMLRLLGLAAAGTAAIGLASCAPSPPRPAPQPRPPAGRPAPRPGVPSPAAYLAEASSIDLYEIKSSQIALTRTSNGWIRNFASTMISAHTGTSSQLSFAGRRLNLLPSATLLPRHQALISELEASGDFDGTYKRQQLAIHQEALRLHSNYAARGTSPTLKPVAANAVPIIRRHLEMLKSF